jgi:hypothetical protein
MSTNSIQMESPFSVSDPGAAVGDAAPTTVISLLLHEASEESLGLGVAEAPQHQAVELKKECVFAQIGERDESREHHRWALDSGATNQMTILRSTITELDSGIHGSVKFGDGSVINIEGHGTILFIGNGGEHHRLSGVYLMPRLKSNIVSLGQLDEGGCLIYIE